MACWIFDPVQTQARGIFGSPVGTQLQVKETAFWTKCSLLVIAPPRAVQAWVFEPGASRRNSAELGGMDCWFGRVSQDFDSSGSHAQFTGRMS